MYKNTLKETYQIYKESTLLGRYIHHEMIAPLLEKFAATFEVECIGKSVMDEPIFSVTLGSGSKKVLMWSQMHGNESTTTKAIFDLLNTLTNDSESYNNILEECQLKIIPILNPDGAKAYTRLNANDIDLNRDAQDRSQPESKILQQVFNSFKPDYCFNLHGQRTIFSAGPLNHPATVSFLAPSQDIERSVTETRKVAMEIIAQMNNHLQNEIKDQVGIYDDSFNLNCVGDTFQAAGVPTVLFEAGHFANDYSRDVTRRFIYESLIIALTFIADNNITGDGYKSYFQIPKNEKRFYDVIIKDSSVGDIAIQFQERLIENSIDFVPKIEKISNLDSYHAHKSINARGYEVLGPQNEPLIEGNEIDFVIINNERFSLFS